MRKRLAGLEDQATDKDPRSAAEGETTKSKPQNVLWKPILLLVVPTLVVYLRHSSASSWDSIAEDACRSYDGLYFSNLLETIRQMPPNASSLCDPELQNCRCKNPMKAVRQVPDRVRNWQEIHQMNMDLISQSNKYTDPLELVLYGDSITERLLGRMFGKSGRTLKEYTTITERILTKKGGGSINGLPLGISSDEIPHLLYRLQNGELPAGLQPKVFWFLIGTNDARMGCFTDVIVAGNIGIVQELRQHSAVAPIVINSLLPRGAQALTAPSNNLWRILRNANQQLACYAAQTPGVYFANVTEKFIMEAKDDGNVFIHPDMFVKDRVHISTHGSRIWEEFMVQRVLSLLA